ncbi:U4/U6.U5 snRNP associated protein [Malassezia vespertilionis]|uniref:U1-type domain-containing protein n=1 Tax=Malassezia vespertilionis TaxID=2020962 RepID=A0A2N1J6Y5_9BASI|nr:U4/U6.U5 snRNP associated protein [Malassezia vespertilionis]PKI82304.1 hypothetical protein MVES_003783 [Malassezia vespertilionis]WFD07939.1 U4/U6.U5 snRNP associated protein [Malassezia vespertilionis]
MAPAAASGGVGPSRRQWDIAEYSQRARDRDRERREHAIENEERLKQGKRPQGKRRDDLPKPTQTMQAHQDLGLEKNLGKSVLVENAEGSSGNGTGHGAGFYCEVCRKMCKDSVAYLDHINGRSHLRRIGQSTQVERATLEQVLARIEHVRDELALGPNAEQRYDFAKRLQEIAAGQRAEHEAKLAARREARARNKHDKEALKHDKEEIPAPQDADAMMAAMGFAAFGSSKP